MILSKERKRKNEKRKSEKESGDLLRSMGCPMPWALLVSRYFCGLRGSIFLSPSSRFLIGEETKGLRAATQLLIDFFLLAVTCSPCLLRVRRAVWCGGPHRGSGEQNFLTGEGTQEPQSCELIEFTLQAFELYTWRIKTRPLQKHFYPFPAFRPQTKHTPFTLTAKQKQRLRVEFFSKLCPSSSQHPSSGNSVITGSFLNSKFELCIRHPNSNPSSQSL